MPSAANLRHAFSSFASGSSATETALVEELRSWSPDLVAELLADWQIWARDDQLPPAAAPDGPPWRTWLILGGRGAGKTRAGAEWVRAMALGIAPIADAPAERIALVGETMHDVRAVMVEGVSGILAVHRDGECPVFEPSRARLVWPNGAIAELFSADSPGGLRGPQFAAAWCDEIAKWRYGEDVWDMLQFALRIGDWPRAVATTTPRPVPLVKRLLDDRATVTTRARTSANSAYLASTFLAEMERRYHGTLLGAQELDGEMIDGASGALWRSDWIESARVGEPPELARIVVGLDPPVTSDSRSDACGIVVAGLGADRRGYVLADRTIQGRTPDVWARAAVAAYEDFAADCIVAEVNQGGDLVESVLRQVAPSVAIRKVRASRGKWVRAEPVAALYAEGRVAHVGRHAELEAEMAAFGADGKAGGRSPDRMDALVWALTDLLLGPRLGANPGPSMRRL